MKIVSLCYFILLCMCMIPVSGNPEEPFSVITNGRFSEWADGSPVGWRVTKGDLLHDREMSYGSRGALRITKETSHGDGPSILSQQIKLTPGGDYQLRLRMAKDGQGIVLIRIQPTENGRMVSGGTPALDWSNVWSTGFPWAPVELGFRAGEHDEYRVSIISHGRVGDAFWVEDVGILPKSQLNLSEDSYKLFSQSIMIPIEPLGMSSYAEEIEDLYLSGVPGEYAVVQVGIRSPVEVDGVDLQLSGDLLSESGERFFKDRVTVRMVGEQALLPLSQPSRVAKGGNLGWWVTVSLPEDLEPEEYRGSLNLSVNGRVVREIPLIVRAESFELPQSDIPMFVYHNERYFPSGGFLTEELRARYYQDMREHGMNTVTVYNTPDVDGKNVDFDRDYTWKISDERIEQMNKGGYQLTREEVDGRHEFGLNRVMPLIQNSGLTDAGLPVLWLTHKGGIYGWGDMPSPVLESSVNQWLDHKEWPKPLLYVLDEPEGHPDRIAAARRALDRIKKLDLPVPTVTANVAVKELGSDYDVWIQLEKRINPEMVAQAREYNADLWVYNCNMYTGNAALTRILFGFWAYRSGVNGVGLWAYYDSKEWYMDEVGQVHGQNGRFGFSRVCPSPQGPVPTISWETTREGVNDYRYAMLFDQLMEEAQKRADEYAGRSEEALSEEDKERLAAEPDWTPEDPGKSEIVRLYRKSEELKKLHQVGKRARSKLIESIPMDAMSTMGAHPFSANISGWVPVTGLGDPRLIPEQQRKNLRAYIRRLDQALR